MNDSLDLFKIRRCTFELHPDPSFPGCVYSEMKMCLAPCFKGCTDEAYAAEVARVRAYFDSAGESLIQELEAERDRLSAALDFEGAAQQHARIVKIKSILSGADEICRRLDCLDVVIVQPSSEKDAVTLFRFNRGSLVGPALLTTTTDPEVETASPDQRLRPVLDALAASKTSSGSQIVEELSILKRWYYRSHKSGEIVLAKGDVDLPIRKLLNAIHRVAYPKTEATKDNKEPEELQINQNPELDGAPG